MENQYANNFYKSIVEKNESIKATLFRKYGDNYLNAENPNKDDYYAFFLHELIGLCNNLDIGFEKIRNSPPKIINYLQRNRDLSKSNWEKAFNLNDGKKGMMYKLAIDGVIDPLIDSCISSLQNQINEILACPNSYSQKNTFTKNVAEKIKRTSSQEFSQIDCSASFKEIKDFFMILTKELNPVNGKPYMTEQDVMSFLESNFLVFGKPRVQKFYTINIVAKSTLAYFIYQFYQKYDSHNTNNKIKYAKLLIHNFEIFSGENPEILKSNMGESKRPKNRYNVIDVEKYNAKK